MMQPPAQARTSPARICGGHPRATTTVGAPSLAETLQELAVMFPPETALSWDRVGLVVGDPAQPVRRIWFAVDPTLDVVEDAVADEADLLVTHHPLLLRGVHSVATTSAKGAVVTRLIRAGLALATAHTNADVADPGVCDALTEVFGLADVVPLTHEEGRPLGRLGRLPETMSLRDFAAAVASVLPAAPVGIRVAGPAQAPVTTVAVLGGAGDGLFDAVRAAGADVYVTADLRHHPALEAREEARGGPPYLVDAGHWATEWVWLSAAAERLRQALAARGLAVTTTVSNRCTDPWSFVLGASTPDEDEPGHGPAVRRSERTDRGDFERNAQANEGIRRG